MGASFWLCGVITERWERRRKARPGVHATNVQTSETQGSYQPLDEAANETASLCAVVAGFGRRAPQPVPGNRLLFGFDDIPPCYLNRLVTLGCEVRPSFRLVERHCVIQAVPFDDGRTLGRRPTLYLNNPSGCGA
jgi:hypothetical protein